MRRLAASGCLALLIAGMPLTLLAQAAPLDEASRATVVMMAQRTAAAVDAQAVASSASDAPEVTEPAPEPAAEPTEELTDEPLALPELNLTDLVEYSNQGITIRVPADWIVETDVTDDRLFSVEVPGTEIAISLEADTDLDFPSWLGVALFRSQAELLTQEMGSDIRLENSTVLYTSQNLPVAKLSISGTEDGELVSGALYVTAPNDVAYLVVGGGTAAEWEYAAPGIELMVESIVFDEELVTVVEAGDEPLLFSDAEAGVEVTVPAQWYVMVTGDEQFPVMAAEREVRYVAAIGTEASFGEEFDPEILEVIIPEGELDPSEAEELIAEILQILDDAGSPIMVDEDSSEVIPREGAVTVKLVGDAEIDNGLMMPIIFYVDLRQSGAGVVIIFGDTASALEVEPEIQALLESVSALE